MYQTKVYASFLLQMAFMQKLATNHVFFFSTFQICTQIQQTMVEQSKQTKLGGFTISQSQQARKGRLLS